MHSRAIVDASSHGKINRPIGTQEAASRLCTSREGPRTAYRTGPTRSAQSWPPGRGIDTNRATSGTNGRWRSFCFVVLSRFRAVTTKIAHKASITGRRTCAHPAFREARWSARLYEIVLFTSHVVGNRQDSHVGNRGIFGDPHVDHWGLYAVRSRF